MFNPEQVKKFAENWAYDMSSKVISQGELVNEDVINQSIEMILATPLGSRLFNLNFGSNFMYRLFDNMDSEFYNDMLNDTVEAIKKWEDRIIILESDMRLVIDTDRNTVRLTIPYFIKDRQIKGEFSKVISQ